MLGGLWFVFPEEHETSRSQDHFREPVNGQPWIRQRSGTPAVMWPFLEQTVPVNNHGSWIMHSLLDNINLKFHQIGQCFRFFDLCQGDEACP